MNKLHININEIVLHHGRLCRIKAILDVRRVLLCPVEPGERPLSADVVDLRPAPQANARKDEPEEDLAAVPDASLAEAQRRLDIIRPLLTKGGSNVFERAAEFEMHPATLYRWIKDYRRTGMVRSLMPQFHRRGGPLKSRLPKEVLDVVDQAVNDFYLKMNRPSITETAREVTARCLTKEPPLRAPSLTAVRNRILALTESRVVRDRHGKKAAERFRPAAGTLPGATHPWAIVHMDHTKLDLMLVDRETRQPLGRPYITLAEDAFSRVIVGLYLSLDPPGSLSVGMCASNSILPKEAWMARRKVVGDWPVWGKPDVLHVDNAKEFWGRMVERACEEMGTSIHWRRVGEPRDGARIERLIGTINQEIHSLPGATFSNIADRGENKPEKEAVLTFDEAEWLIVDFVVNTYHRRRHSKLGGMPPIKVWQDGLLVGAEEFGRGLPERYVNEQSIRLRFMPYEERTVQPYGIELHGLTYWCDQLRHWISARDPENRKLQRKFIVRHDPRDLSRIWFYDPGLKEHIEVPYRDLTLPPISLWELREARRQLRREGKTHIDERALFAARERRRLVVEQAKRESKAMRLARERHERGLEGSAEAVTRSKHKRLSAPPPLVAAGPRRPARERAFAKIKN